MDEVFPKMAKCQFNRHGPGGGIQVGIQLQATAIDNHQALCVTMLCFSEPRRPLPAPPQHREREDLPLHVGVAHLPRRRQRSGSHLQV